MYKSSNYNFYFQVNEKNYVYNILTTAICEINEQVGNALQSNPNILEKDIILALIKEGFIVDANLDEKKQYQYYYDRLRFGEGTRNLHLMIVPTYNCNLRCPYCYEGNDKKNKKMTKENINSILLFVNNKLLNKRNEIKIEKIVISLYGGEPLMEKELLIYFCDKVSDLALQFGVKIVFDMTTNLTLLDSAVIECIKKHEINVQVSIDGTKKDHNERRIYSNGQGTYDKIIENLEKLYKAGLKDFVTIRLNVDENNIKDISQELSYIKKYSNDIYFGYLTKYINKNDEFQEKCIENCDYSKIDSQKLHDILVKNGLIVPQRFGKKAPCSLCSRNKYIIDCYMNVYKCELLINHTECKVGEITPKGELIFNSNYYKQINYSPFKFEKCTNCKYLPMCAGGCPARVFLNTVSKEKEVTEMYDCSIMDNDLKEYLTDYVKRMTLG